LKLIGPEKCLFQKNALVPAQLPIDFEEKETVYFRK
jgi:hypothetical protein